MKTNRVKKLMALILTLSMCLSMLPSTAYADTTKTAVASTTDNYQYPIRALFVDAGRKYFSVEWFKKMIDEMAAAQMNTLFISFSNDEGFRFLLDDFAKNGLTFANSKGETVTYSGELMGHIVDNPESAEESETLKKINADDADAMKRYIRSFDNSSYLSEADMESILAYAADKGISVVPEFNSPGHMGQLLWYFPEYRKEGAWFEQGIQPHYSLDLRNPDAVLFANAIIRKYVDWFESRGCVGFMLGGDEYKAKVSDEVIIADEVIAAYINAQVKYVQQKGMTAYVWNDGQAVTSGLINQDAVINCWNNAGLPTNLSNPVLNFNSNQLYYVLKGSNDWTVTLEKIAAWEPTGMPNSINESNTVLGGSLAIWCDDAKVKTPEVIYEELTGKTYASETANAMPIAEIGAGSVLAAFGNKLASYRNIASADDSEFIKLPVYDAIPDGTYLIVGHGNGEQKYAVSNIAYQAGMGAHGTSGGLFAKATSPMERRIITNDATLKWDISSANGGGYVIQSVDNSYYLVITGAGDNTVRTQSDETTLSAAFGANKGYVAICNTGMSGYLDYYHKDRVDGWNSGLGNANERLWLYKSVADLGAADLNQLVLMANSYLNQSSSYNADRVLVLQGKISEANRLIDEINAGQSYNPQDIANLISVIYDAIISLPYSMQYIEIPVEILDFRADGVLFEYDQNGEGTPNSGAYDLLKNWAHQLLGGTGPGDYTNLPGMSASSSDKPSEETWRRTGLTLDRLVDGKIAYTQETVEYVAKLIDAGCRSDLRGTVNHAGNHSTVVSPNMLVYDKVGTVSGTLGSWSETLQKVGGMNGAPMAWDQIATATDLAYYLLNNLWQSTTDHGDLAEIYNTKVPEISKIKMLLDPATGLYTLDSSKLIRSANGEIYNQTLAADSEISPGSFDPIRGLGYEGNGFGYGDNTDAVTGQNFHFTMHAYGSFVYYADEDLEFSFRGDDDVYFFINGRLAMDIGGAHSPCAAELKLNDIADTFGFVDGEIYSFDMFYAERHTTASNLKFATNIKIMDTLTTTSKTQYNLGSSPVENPDYDSLDPLAFGAVVETGSVIAYGLNILNLRSLPIYELSFKDESLGVFLSKDVITLPTNADGNGVGTSITDLDVIYHTYDRPAPTQQGALNGSHAQIKTASEMLQLIAVAKSNNQSLPAGSYVVHLETDQNLKDLLSAGVPIDTQICVTGFRRKAINTDRPYINTVETTAFYDSNGVKTASNGIARQKLVVFNSFTLGDKLQYVVDYGLDMRIPLDTVKSVLQLNDGVSAEFAKLSFTPVHGGLTLGLLSGTAGAGTYSSAAYPESEYVVDTENITFKLKETMSRVQKVCAVYKITDSSLAGTDYATYYVAVELNFIPANAVYYENYFPAITLSAGTPAWVELGGNKLTTQSIGTVGDTTAVPYGYDSVYAEGTSYTGNHAVRVDVPAGTAAAALPTATFTFKGTGVDVISATGAMQGLINIKLYKGTTASGEVFRKVSVQNTGEVEMTGIPAISVRDLPYDTYTAVVTAFAAYTNEQLPGLNRGGQFVLDGIRICHPANESEITVHDAYQADQELFSVERELRNAIIDAASFNAVTGGDGIVYVDKDQNGSGTATVADYTSVGPNNEVYLKNASSVLAFILETDKKPETIQIGARALYGDATLKIRGEADAVYLERLINHTLSMNYKLIVPDNKFVQTGDGKWRLTLYIENAGAGLLSLTEFKVTFAEASGVSFVYNPEILDAITQAEPQTVDPSIVDVKLKGRPSMLRGAVLVVTTDKALPDNYSFTLDCGNRYKVRYTENAVSSMRRLTVSEPTANGDGTYSYTLSFRPNQTGSVPFSLYILQADGTSISTVTGSIRIYIL